MGSFAASFSYLKGTNSISGTKSFTGAIARGNSHRLQLGRAGMDAVNAMGAVLVLHTVPISPVQLDCILSSYHELSLQALSRPKILLARWCSRMFSPPPFSTWLFLCP